MKLCDVHDWQDANVGLNITKALIKDLSGFSQSPCTKLIAYAILVCIDMNKLCAHKCQIEYKKVF